jgi:hypothetical protein
MNIRKKLISAALATVIGSAALFVSPTVAGAAEAPVTYTTFAAGSCTWRYVVTDGVFNDVQIFDSLDSTHVIGFIHPNEFFQSPSPYLIAAGRHGTRLQIYGGWVNLGDWIQLQGCG